MSEASSQATKGVHGGEGTIAYHMDIHILHTHTLIHKLTFIFSIPVPAMHSIIPKFRYLRASAVAWTPPNLKSSPISHKGKFRA